jgi:hypothetical protein
MDRNPYTRALHPKPIMDDDGRWLYYECSKCGALIDAKQEDKEGLEKLYIAHVQSSHTPREDFSQAAARIVKEATEKV